VLIAAMLAIGRAGAHELTCDKTVNGEEVLTVDHYPTTLNWSLVVSNAHPTAASDVLDVSDPMLESFGFAFSPAPPFSLDVGASASDTFSVTVESYADCIGLDEAGFLPFKGGPQPVDNVMTVTWDLGSAECRARVICVSEKDCQSPSCPSVAAGEASRTMGFWMTYETALAHCIDLGPIDLGFITITTRDVALGMLWASPTRFSNGAMRSDLDEARLLVGRQTLAAICNERLFGASDAGAIPQAQTALRGRDCALLGTLETQLDAFNRSGDATPIIGFDPGLATPEDAQAHAIDPTFPSNQSCR
jgi:hypothetical protein